MSRCQQQFSRLSFCLPEVEIGAPDHKSLNWIERLHDAHITEVHSSYP
jgi:hypothetical protein